jgi:predicted signal transduction protein with EAL and GGDEF domain
MSDPFVLSGGREVRIGASIGVTYLSGAADNVELLIQQADAALYAAKISGRGAVRVFDPATCEIAAG